MSLHVHLNLPGITRDGSGIYVRENGRIKELTQEEWNERFPDREPVRAIVRATSMWSANITHNLTEMAEKAGLYIPIWQPDEAGIHWAAELIEPLEKGLALLKGDPKEFEKYNPPNGWGDYDGFVGFVEEYLEACRDYPGAQVSANG